MAQPGFSYNYWLDALLQSLNLKLPTWIRIFDQKNVEIVPLCGILKDRNCQKGLLVLTYLGIQTNAVSTLPTSFLFPSRFQSIVWSGLLVSKYPFIWPLFWNWNLNWTGVTKLLLVQTYLETPNHPSRKRQCWIVISSSELTLSCYYMTLTLKNLWFYSLNWFEFFHHALHWRLFRLKEGFFSQINCRIFNLSFLSRLDGKYCSATAPLVLW